MSDVDLDVYVSTFQRTGMVGAFNRYRPRDWLFAAGKTTYASTSGARRVPAEMTTLERHL